MRFFDLHRTVTRRATLAGLMGFVSTVVAACSGPSRLGLRGAEQAATATEPSNAPEPTTTPAGASTATATPTSPPAEPAAAATTAPEEVRVEPQGVAEPNLEGSFGRAISGLQPSLPREIHIPFAAVTSPKLQVREISYDDLVAVWNLEIDNWRELGDPVSSPVRRYTFPDMALPIEPFGGDVPIQSIDDLAESLWQDRGGIALIPARDVDHRFRTLQVDGVDILGQRGAPNPLLLQMYGVPEEIAPETLLPRSQPAKLTFVGDIIFGRYVQKALEQRGDFAASFRSIAPELKRADLTIGDLECSLSDSFEQPERTNPQTFQFKTGTVTVSGLELADIDVLSRANNHSFNFGPIGMDDTTRTLDGAGIKHFGMGHTLEEARRPAICQVGDLSFAFVGYNGVSDYYDGATADSPGTSPMIEEFVREDVSNAVAAGHIVIPFFHWGIEYVALPTEQQRRFAHAAIEAGASIVIGSHPHWVQAVETYQGRPIIYSLGNFVFDQAWSRETTEGVFANVWFEGARVTGIDYRPILIVEEHRPILLDEDGAYSVLERIWSATEEVRSWG